jgi:hypothetical protein
MNTPRMQEAWDKSSRTADGFYSSQTPASEYATSCYDEGCKLERELADAIRERDEAREQRDMLAAALINCMPFISGEGCGEYSDAKLALQSLTTNAEPIHGEKHA